MQNINPLFQQILGSHGVQSLDSIMSTPAEQKRQQQTAEEFAAHIAEMRARLDRHEHVIDLFLRK